MIARMSKSHTYENLRPEIIKYRRQKLQDLKKISKNLAELKSITDDMISHDSRSSRTDTMCQSSFNNSRFFSSKNYADRLGTGRLSVSESKPKLARHISRSTMSETRLQSGRRPNTRNFINTQEKRKSQTIEETTNENTNKNKKSVQANLNRLRQKLAIVAKARGQFNTLETKGYNSCKTLPSFKIKTHDKALTPNRLYPQKDNES